MDAPSDDMPSGEVLVRMETATVGDTVEFGQFSWLVLDSTDDRLLLIASEVTERRAYNSSDWPCTWETSSVRSYLNGAWLEWYFSEAEMERIVSIAMDNPDNPKYGTDGGSARADRVFLLSLEEVEQYLPLAADRIAHYGDDAYWWWLRTPGRHANSAVVVDPSGDIIMSGHGVGGYATDYTGFGGLRPALWVGR